jgi:hypothetical protein
MSASGFIWAYLIIALITANLPWLTERRFLLLPALPSGIKPIWMRLIEWFLLYLLIGLVGLGLEQRLNGEIHAQDWEFYVVTLSLFFVFALPGFIWRHDWNHHG